jgi:SAM-dependent methyltransferase
MREYDLIADWYSSDRGRTIGVAEALAVAATLPADARILDAGSGTGIPITRALVQAGYRVVGLDSSGRMIAHFRTGLPRVRVVQADVRHCPFIAESFDAAVSWGVLFHLTAPDQAHAFAEVSRLLRPGAPFLFTGAEIEGATAEGITGTMNGVTFRYYAVASYRTLLAEHALTLDDVYQGPGANTYFLARKR